jgi:hypothetical protein
VWAGPTTARRPSPAAIPEEVFDESMALAGFILAPEDNEVRASRDEAAQARTVRV